MSVPRLVQSDILRPLPNPLKPTTFVLSHEIVQVNKTIKPNNTKNNLTPPIPYGIISNAPLLQKSLHNNNNNSQKHYFSTDNNNNNSLPNNKLNCKDTNLIKLLRKHKEIINPQLYACLLPVTIRIVT